MIIKQILFVVSCRKQKKILFVFNAETYKLKIVRSYTRIIYSINRVIYPVQIDLLCSQPIAVGILWKL